MGSLGIEYTSRIDVDKSISSSCPLGRIKSLSAFKAGQYLFKDAHAPWHDIKRKTACALQRKCLAMGLNDSDGAGGTGSRSESIEGWKALQRQLGTSAGGLCL